MSLTGMRSEVIRRGVALQFSEAPGDHEDWKVLTLDIQNLKGNVQFTNAKPFKFQGNIRNEDSREAVEYALLTWAMKTVPDPKVKDETVVVVGYEAD